MTGLGVKIFADGADGEQIAALAADPRIRGVTTNPTLMRKAGVEDYHLFAKELVAALPDLPLSFEVISDDFPTMAAEARAIARFGPNVFVKVPVTSTRGEPADTLLAELAAEGVQVNVTALMTVRQVEQVTAALAGGPPGYVSVFAGRIADSGRDPVPTMRAAVGVLASEPQLELIWASPREVLNVVQADQVGCHVITLTPDLLAKLPLLGRDLDQFSLDTVKMFHDDARAAGYHLETGA